MRSITKLRFSSATLLSLISLTLIDAGNLPAPRCATDECIPAAGHICWDGVEFLEDYKLKIGFDG